MKKSQKSRNKKGKEIDSVPYDKLIFLKLKFFSLKINDKKKKYKNIERCSLNLKFSQSKLIVL